MNTRTFRSSLSTLLFCLGIATSQAQNDFGFPADLNQIDIWDERSGRSQIIAGDYETGLFVDYRTYVGASDLFPGYTVFGFEIANNDTGHQLTVNSPIGLRGDWNYLQDFTYEGVQYHENLQMRYQINTEAGGGYVPATEFGASSRSISVVMPPIHESERTKFWILSRAPGYSTGGMSVTSTFDPQGPGFTIGGSPVPIFTPDYLQPVPEPSSMILLTAAGAIGLAVRRRRAVKS